MKKILQKISSIEIKWQLVVGSFASFLFFLLRSIFINEGTDSLWGSNLLQWMSIPIMMLTVAIPFYVLYVIVEKKEKLIWQHILASILSIVGVLIFFVS